MRTIRCFKSNIPRFSSDCLRLLSKIRFSGEYILFVDSDDFIASNMCELMYEKAVQGEDDIVICKYYDVREKTLTKKLVRTKSKSYNVSYERYPCIFLHIPAKSAPTGPCSRHPQL